MASSFGSSTLISASTEMVMGMGIFTDHIGSPTRMAFPVETGPLSCFAEQQRVPPNSFTCFSSLPAELRLQAWELASNEPRKIDLKCEKLKGRNSRTWKFESITRQPSVLQVNRESRCVGLGFYELGLQHHSRDDDRDEEGYQSSFYANWIVDTLWPLDLRTWDSEALGLLFQEKSMKTLALNIETISCGWFLGLWLSKLIIYSASTASKDTLNTMLGSPSRFQLASLEPVSIDVDDEAEIQRLRDASRGVEGWGLLMPSEGETLAFLQARIWVKGEFEELERVQRLWREWMEEFPGEEVPREVLRSAVFDDAFSRSGLWLKKEEELPVVRKMPEIGFARVVLG